MMTCLLLNTVKFEPADSGNVSYSVKKRQFSLLSAISMISTTVGPYILFKWYKVIVIFIPYDGKSTPLCDAMSDNI